MNSQHTAQIPSQTASPLRHLLPSQAVGNCLPLEVTSTQDGVPQVRMQAAMGCMPHAGTQLGLGKQRR